MDIPYWLITAGLAGVFSWVLSKLIVLVSSALSLRFSPPPPVNELAGIVLPDPRDPRWCREKHDRSFLCMGAVRVRTDHYFVFVDGYNLDELFRGAGGKEPWAPVRAYGEAVVKGYIQARAEEAVLDEGPVPRVRMLP